MRYKHVIFDLDGTLYDSLGAGIGALVALLDEERPGHEETYQSLLRFSGLPGRVTLEELGFASSQEEYERCAQKWTMNMLERAAQVKLFPEIIPVLLYLKRRGVTLGIVTSRDRSSEDDLDQVGAVLPFELAPYISRAISASDTPRGKPFPDPILKYLNDSHAKAEETLYVGDTKSDYLCARDCGVDFALALWGGCPREHLPCRYYLRTPWDVMNIVTQREIRDEPWLNWARELQAIGQIGQTYSKDKFDLERFARLREIACEIAALGSGEDPALVRQALCFESGYCCPKVDTRAAIFNERHQILMVREYSGLWDLPGGWCDDGESVCSNTVKEAFEEACMQVTPLKLIAIHERNRHNTPRYAYGTLKFFIECAPGPWHFAPTDETLECRYFSEDELPLDMLRVETNNEEQLRLCFQAHYSKTWIPVIE